MTLPTTATQLLFSKYYNQPEIDPSPVFMPNVRAFKMSNDEKINQISHRLKAITTELYNLASFCIEMN
jgi:hypothetical protein